MNILIQLVFLVIGFLLLIKGADIFVEGASKIADKFHIPQIVIGLTIVAFGTSAPEAAISISSALKEGSTGGIAIGNILGSNIMNILLIIGITSLILPLKIQENTLKYEVPFVILISVVLLALGRLDGQVNFVDGIILWALFILFFAYLIRISKSGASDVTDDVIQASENDSFIKLILMIVIGMAAIVLGSNVTVDAATKIATIIGISERVIGLTIVAFGTSLPELITSITAAKKGKDDIAIGNIVGSNIFNILFVIGTTALITSVPFAKEFVFDGIMAIAAAVILLLSVIKNKKVNRVSGGIMLVCYIAYFIHLIL